MSEVKQPVEHMSTGRPEAGAYYAELYNTAQFELSALREELAEYQKILASYKNNYVTKLAYNAVQLSLTAAEQRNAELTQALERGKLWLELFRAWFGDYGVSQEDHAAIIRTLRGLPHPPSEFDKTTESGASE